MWLSLLLVALIIGISIRQATQGLFSSLIMLVLTLSCAATAVGTYEWIAIQWVAPMWRPSFAMSISLALAFAVPLIVLRLLFDKVIKRACLLPAIVDRAGAGICGVITAMTIVGVLALALQMLPFHDGSILGFSRVTPIRPDPTGADSSASESAEERSLLLSPDKFVVKVAAMLSAGIFSSELDFHEHNPNLTQVIGWVGATHGGVSRYAPPGSMSIIATQEVDTVYRLKPGDARSGEGPTYEPIPPTAGKTLRMVRVRLSNKARDENKTVNFTLRQFRMVGRQGKSGPLEQYFPVAIQQEDANDPTNRHIRLKGLYKATPVIDEVFAPRGGGMEIEMVFELPESFLPTFLEYKRSARQAIGPAEAKSSSDSSATAPVIPTSSKASDTPPPASRRASRRSHRSTSSDAPPTRRRKGNVRGVTVKEGGTRFSDELPITLTSYRGLKNADVKRGAMVSGHLIADYNNQAEGSDPPVAKFHVPADKRLLQFEGEKLQAGSTLGKALSFAVATLQNYFVQDERGRRYKVTGKYAIADVNGTKTIEVQYFSNPVGAIGGMGKFSKINEKTLKRDDRFVLLFLVDPGATIVRFSTGGAATRADDLTSQNLTAPD